MGAGDAARAQAGRARRAVGGADTAPHWVSGVLAGLQGALLSLLAVVVPALAAYVATSADPSNADVGWPRSAGVGAALWLMGHGTPLRSDGVTLTIVPLGVTALALFTAYASARRSAHPTVLAWVAGTVGYVGFVLAVALLLGRAGPMVASGPDLLRLAVGALCLGAVGLGAGTVRLHRIRELSRPWWSRLDPLLRVGAGGGVMVLALLVGIAAATTAAWTVSHRAAAGDVISGLGVDAFGGLLMAVAQTAFAPNLVLWMVAWLAGPGFSVGAGTLFSPTEVVSGPLPALPMLTALPTAVGDVALMQWVPAVVVLAGGVVGWWLEHRLPDARAWQVPLACAWAALSAGLLTAAATLLAAGAAGPGRLAVVGAPAVTVGLTVTLLSAAGLLLVALPASRAVRAGVAARARSAWGRMRGRADLPLADPPAPDEP